MSAKIPKLHTETLHRPGHQISQIKRGLELAVPTPDNRNVHTQLGVSFEEVTEILRTLQAAGKNFPSREQICFDGSILEYIQRPFKVVSDGAEVKVKDLNRRELLDSLCDQIVTAVGVAHMLGLDIEGALKEVADSNDSKFDAQGRPIFNEQRKIVKEPNYRALDLSPHI